MRLLNGTFDFYSRNHLKGNDLYIPRTVVDDINCKKHTLPFFSYINIIIAKITNSMQTSFSISANYSKNMCKNKMDVNESEKGII